MQSKQIAAAGSSCTQAPAPKPYPNSHLTSPPHVSTGSRPSSGLRLLYICLGQMDEKKKKKCIQKCPILS